MNHPAIDIDERLVEAAKDATGIADAAKVVDLALRELLKKCTPERIMSLKGAVHWEGDLREMRRGRGAL